MSQSMVDIERVIDEFEEMTRNAGTVQRETLEKILEVNKEAEYLVKLGLNGRTDPVSFRKCVPLVSHPDIEPYIRRILDGDSSPILTGKPITTLSISSGTTHGRRKYIPFNDDLFENTMQIYETSFAYRNKEFPINNTSKSLQFIYSSKSNNNINKNNSNNKITANTATTNIFRHPYYTTRMSSIRSEPCTPSSIILSPPDDFQQSLYCHLLSGLIHRQDIEFIFSTFAHSLIHALDSLTHLYPQLCSDIESGSLNTQLVTDKTLRHAMSHLLTHPNPNNAASIRSICQKLSDQGWDNMVTMLFPKVKYMYGIFTGSMEPYVKKLRMYAGNGLPLVAADYGSSEGWIAVNVNPRTDPESATFVMVPNIGYFEFLPVSKPNEPAVGLSDVEVGKEYEVIVTNFAGLYRYKLGDVVQVVGFHNKSPMIKFICRSNLILNINIDKTTEKDLYLAVERAEEILVAADRVDLVDFTSLIERSVDPGHYVVFWEVKNEDDQCLDGVLQQCCDCLDKAFVDIGYVGARKGGGIGALELRVVRRGTFLKVMEYYLGLGNTANQFKTPRCVGSGNKLVLQILEEGVVKSYFSTAYES